MHIRKVPTELKYSQVVLLQSLYTALDMSALIQATSKADMVSCKHGQLIRDVLWVSLSYPFPLSQFLRIAN